MGDSHKIGNAGRNGVAWWFPLLIAQPTVLITNMSVDEPNKPKAQVAYSVVGNSLIFPLQLYILGLR